MITGMRFRYCTFNVGFAVFSIRTAHCINVVSGWFVGTTGSTSWDITEEETSVVGAGCGSANSESRRRYKPLKD